jgi:hypothetical protein
MSIDVTPTAIDDAEAIKRLCLFVDALNHLESADGRVPDDAEAESLRQMYVNRLTEIPQDQRVRLTAVINLYTDLAKSGWRLRHEKRDFYGARPGEDSDIRTQRRAQLANRRLEQLREPATREFVSGMERGHVHNGRVVSVFQLMRDGRELSQSLQKALSAADVDAALGACIKPYLQVVDSGGVCSYTGFLLQDIWRYFRHTWTSAYESIPGRSMQLLVRDTSMPFHPVMGIASLASAASVQPVRDREIGWTREEILNEARTQPSSRWADWVLETLEDALDGLYKQDFVEEKVLPLRLAQLVPDEVIENLLSIGQKARDRHIKQAELEEHKGAQSEPTDSEGWARIARLDLYRSKRASELAVLLGIRNVVLAAYAGKRGKTRLESLLSTGAGRGAFEKLIRRARSASVGTAIADLNVCGAVAPYNELLGGKLVAMLAVSPQVVREYKNRYRGKASWIASRMAGNPFTRHADLVFVGTTSLYGTRPSQYDRAGYPAKLVGGAEGELIRYRFLGNTEGIGTAQFSSATNDAMTKLLQQDSNQGIRVKNIFGEGANPKLRLMREAIAVLGIRAGSSGPRGDDGLLMHGMSKAAYGVRLVNNLRDYLLGIAKRPQYLFKLENEQQGTERICKWWLQRWVRRRLERPDTLGHIAANSLVRPVRHGARVTLPDADVNQLSLL